MYDIEYTYVQQDKTGDVKFHMNIKLMEAQTPFYQTLLQNLKPTQYELAL